MQDVPGERFSFLSDGITLAAWYFALPGDHAPPKARVVMCHGLPSGAPVDPADPGYPGLASRLNEQEYEAVFFNFRGCGESGGNLDLAGWVRDLVRLLDALEERTPRSPAPIAAMASSAGAAVAMLAAAEDRRIAAIAALAAPAHFGFMLDGADPALLVEYFRGIGLIRDPDFPESADQWIKGFSEAQTARYAALLSPRPLLVIHGQDDPTVPVQHARRILEAAGEPKEALFLPDAGHRLRQDERAISRVLDWLDRLFGAK